MNCFYTFEDKEKDLFDLTFVTLTYNQEDMILEHLNSILYQKIKFLKDQRIQLVVSDDASRDNTVDTIKSWFKINKGYFDDVILLTANKNQGTCKSYVKAIKSARGKYVKALAGDDVFLKNDLSKVLLLLSYNDIVLTPPMPFYGDDLSDYNSLKFEKSKFSIKQYLKINFKNIKNRLLPAPETPGIFLNRKVLTEKVLKFISEFDLIEDRSFWISVLEENEVLRIAFDEEAYIGYRQHPASVSKGVVSATTIRYKADQTKLGHYQIRNCKSFFYKLYHAHNLFFQKINFKYKKFFNLQVVFFNIHFYLDFFLKKLRILSK